MPTSCQQVGAPDGDWELAPPTMIVIFEGLGNSRMRESRITCVFAQWSAMVIVRLTERSRHDGEDGKKVKAGCFGWQVDVIFIHDC